MQDVHLWGRRGSRLESYITAHRPATKGRITFFCSLEDLSKSPSYLLVEFSERRNTRVRP